MAMKDFRPIWAQGMPCGYPKFISTSNLLIPSSFFIKSCDLSNTFLQSHFEPFIQIGCFDTIPELGIIAVSEKSNSLIHILDYLEMSKISTLQQWDVEQYSALKFVGLEILMTLQIKVCYQIDLWKWKTKDKVHCLSIPFWKSEIPSVNLSCNPLWWHQVIFKSNMRFILVEMKVFDGKYTCEAISHFFSSKDGNGIDLSVQYISNSVKDIQFNESDLQYLAIQCLCWLPESNILAATSEGICKVDHGTLKIFKLKHSTENISSMTLCKQGLFIGYKTGYIDVINISGSHWHVLETINIDQPIHHLFTSPDYNFLVALTVKGDVCYYDTNDTILKFEKIYLSECGGEVEIGFIGPYSHICATCRKNGSVNMFLTSDGRHLTSFHIKEEIISMATSPLCNCIVVGTRGGFIHFIDVTDIYNPKIVLSERPFDTPVNHLKFDNFGRFLFASACNQTVKMWSGLPSSKFEFLGCKRIPGEVRDISAFTRSEADETVVLILVDFGLSSVREVDNLIIRLKLPMDFIFDSKKYQTDMFGTLNGDALNYQKRRFKKILPKMTMHSTLGAVLCFPDFNKVQSCHVWSDFTNQKLEDIIPAKNLTYIYVSPDEHWIAVADLYGCIQIYSCKDFTLSASSKKYCSSETKFSSYLNFPLFSNHLIYCRENGVLIFYEWIDDSNFLRNVPEWVIHCLLQTHEENNLLQSFEAEEKLTVHFINKKKTDSEIFPDIHKSFQTHNAWVHAVNFILNKTLDAGTETDDKSRPSNFVFDANLLEKNMWENREKILLLISSKTQNFEKDLIKKELSNKVLSSFSLGLLTQNFSEEIIDSDCALAESLEHVEDCQPNTTSLTNFSFNKTVKRKSKQEILETMKNLIKSICKLKTEFNSDFNHLYSEKPEVSKRLGAAYSKARQILHTLPSLAERDFWGAYLDEIESGRLVSHIDNKSIKNENEKSSEDLDIKKSKDLLENSLTSAHTIQDEFDCRMQKLILKRHFCDYKIFESEIKLHSLLLLTEAEDSFTTLNNDTGKIIEEVKGLGSDIECFIKEILNLEKKMKDSIVHIQKKERHYSFKAEKHCQKINNVKIIELLRMQPALQLDVNSQNPFWPSNSKSIEADDLESITEGFQIQKLRPENVQNAEWEQFCCDKIRIFKLGVVLRNLKDQAIFLSNDKQFCVEARSKLVSIDNILQKSVKYLSLLISKIRMNFYTLQIINFENNKFLVDDCFQEIDFQSVEKISESGNHQLSQAISKESFRLQKLMLLLDEMEQNFQRLCEQNYEMRLKCTDILKEIMYSYQEYKQKFEDSKQNFTDTKAVGDETIESGKKSMLKTLKSHLLSEVPTKDKNIE